MKGFNRALAEAEKERYFMSRNEKANFLIPEADAQPASESEPRAVELFIRNI